jgi:hypothetical protein
MKSSRSSDGFNCVEVAISADRVAMRDSKDPDGPMLTFGPESWRHFIEAIRRGTFDRSQLKS